jgi:hypothetical protein
VRRAISVVPYDRASGLRAGRYQHVTYRPEGAGTAAAHRVGPDDAAQALR